MDKPERLDKLESSLRNLVENKADFETSNELLRDIFVVDKKFFSIDKKIPDSLAEKIFNDPSSTGLREFVKNKENIKPLGRIRTDDIPNILSDGAIPVSADTDYWNNKLMYKNFFFFVIKLEYEVDRKKELAEITRSINRAIRAPSLMLFYYPQKEQPKISLSFVGKRFSKKGKYEKDVVDTKVTMLRDISCDQPSRGHLETLHDLSIKNLLSNVADGDKNVNGLMKQSLRALSVDELNNKFYKELLKWFSDAKKQVRFPSKYKYKDLEGIKQVIKEKTIEPEEQLLRLIIRLMFVWFIKEKGLVPEELFDKKSVFVPATGGEEEQQSLGADNQSESAKEEFLSKHSILSKPLLKYELADGQDSYYRAILQNLFFATLNNPIIDRRFYEGGKDAEFYGGHKLWRYKDLLANPKEFEKLIAKVPFVNGGLFQCLDKKETGGIEYYLDCFSEDPDLMNKIFVPDQLFFDPKEESGLIDIFNRYKFTVEENTPSDVDVALDPELLGNVFQELLAYYLRDEEKEKGKAQTNKDSHRKSTGSYYTNRNVVNYMVQRSLQEYFSNYCSQHKAGISTEYIENLFAVDSNADYLDAKKKDILISAIDNLKVLDPAVGSGAFPMEIMRNLVNLLGKLDPKNKKWKEKQLDRLPDFSSIKKDYKASEKISDEEARSKAQEILRKRQQEIKNNFEKLNHDYLRKLYLIRNSIYGVDVQPIACQLTKLRFFISLAIEQEIDENKENLGIEPLPNIETRFVTGDSLIKLAEIDYKDLEIDMGDLGALKQDLKKVRENIFIANNGEEKAKWIAKDGDLRKQLYNKMKRVYGVMEDIRVDDSKDKNEVLAMIDSLGKVASYDIMDQNLRTDWFDPQWMFGVYNGFDVVIGNPPYVRQEIIKENKFKFNKQHSEVYHGQADLYVYFFSLGYSMLCNSGTLCFITSNKWLKSGYGKKLRKFIKNKTEIKELLDLGDKVFSANVDTSILLFNRGEPLPDNEFTSGTQINEEGSALSRIKQSDLGDDIFIIASPEIYNLKTKIEKRVDIRLVNGRILLSVWALRLNSIKHLSYQIKRLKQKSAT